MSKKALHEVNRCHDPAFPVELYQVTHAGMLPPGRGLGDFHWHEELQFTLLTAGEGVMQVNAQDYPLRAGQAIFLGSGCIHAVTRLSPSGRYVSLNFPPRMLGFFPGSRMEQQDVLPYAVGSGWQVLTLGAEVDWQREALELLQAGHTVSETAGLCGFNQVSNFIHAFKSVAGCTPLQFVKHRP